MNIQKLLKHIFILILFCIAILVTLPQNGATEAQDDSWTATIWIGDETATSGSPSNLYIVNGDGTIDTIPVSPWLGVPEPYQIFDVITSSDNHYIAAYGVGNVTSRRFVHFGETDLGSSGQCCTAISSMVSEVLDFNLASFEPDGSRFALAYVRGDDSNNLVEDGMLVVNAATSEIEYQADVETVQSESTNSSLKEWAFFGDWTDDGIQLLIEPYTIPRHGGEYSIWQPENSSFHAGSGIYFGKQGARLELTGELLLRGQDQRYFYNPMSVLVTSPNVISYFPNGDIHESSIVAFADTNSYFVGPAYWVGDGNAFLVEDIQNMRWDIVYRDGTTQQIDDLNGASFLAGSPDGWFATGEEGGNSALYHYDLDTLEPTLVVSTDTSTAMIRITKLLPLGGSITSRNVTSVPPPDVAQTAVCPGFLPSRLVVEQSGRVTPGAANQMRSYAGTSADVVGSIPGGAIFSVIAGPSCDFENGIAWWLVNYNGIEGWTAEGQADTYWTEPVE